MPDVLPYSQETSSQTTGHQDRQEAAPAARKGERLGRQAQLPVASGFEEITPLIAPLSQASASACGDAPVLLIDAGDETGDSMAAYWAY